MKGISITSKGIEHIAAMEINELIGSKCTTKERCVIFEFKKFEELCLLCYKCQSVDRIAYLFGSFGFSDYFKELGTFIKNVNLDKWLSKLRKFKIECIRIGQHDFKSVDAEAKAATLIIENYKGVKFDIKDYEVIFLIYIIDNKCYFGIDFAGFEMNKRDYKIFLHSNSLRGTIAYSLVRESGFKKNEALLDPFSRDGVIAIEAALYATDFPVNYYKKEKFAFLKLKLGINFENFFKKIDKKINKSKAKIFSYDHLFKFVDYSKKNAKIAGVEKSISFSRTELAWLDIKFKKESVDRIVTNPITSKRASLDKIYNDFFYQSEYILKKEGTIALISSMPDFVKKYAEKYNFAVSRERDVWSGLQQLKIMTFKKKNI